LLTGVSDDARTPPTGRAWSPRHLRSTAGASRIRLRRARYGDASIVELTAAAVTESVQTTLASVERLRAPPTDRSSTFHVSAGDAVDGDDAEINLGVVDTDVLRLSLVDLADELFVSPCT